MIEAYEQGRSVSVEYLRSIGGASAAAGRDRSEVGTCARRQGLLR